MFPFWHFQWNVSCIFKELDQTVIPCNVLLLMNKLSRQSPKPGVHTVLTNKHMNAFDMWFELIGLQTHVRAIKQNYCGPVAPLSPLHLVCTNVNQFSSQKI